MLTLLGFYRANPRSKVLYSARLLLAWIEWLAVLENEVSYVLFHLHQRANKNLMHYRRKLPPCKLALGPEPFQRADLFQ